ncbi:chromate transporter [Pontibacillus marinus]|nr:chromate transporter [Pontibacillus marinus]
MVWELFVTFFKIGCVAFGGGYAMIPLIELEVAQHGWLTPGQFTDSIAIASSSPGPIATNCAIFIGYKTAGPLGAIVAGVGSILPSLLLILMLAGFFHKLKDHRVIQAAFYGIRPVITGLIFYAGVRIAMKNDFIGGDGYIDEISILLMLSSLGLFLFSRLHPVFIISLSGFLGILIYT